MGQFSWLDCKTEEQVLDNVRRDVYVLVPKEFGGGHIKEECYEGYGVFGGHDVYDLVADWNREYIDPYMLKKPKRSNWGDWDGADDAYESAVRGWERERRKIADFIKQEKSNAQMAEEYGSGWKRIIGIEIACYDEDNANLRYPIKITHDPNAIYEWCGISKGDPNQGWLVEDDDDWYDDEEW